MSRPSYFMFATHAISANGRDDRTDGTAASSTNTYYSKKFQFSETNGIGFSLRSSGTLTGTFTLQYSDVEHPDETTDTDWDTDSVLTITSPAGSPTYKKYSVCDLKGKWYRVKYVNASGTGNIYGYADGSL